MNQESLNPEFIYNFKHTVEKTGLAIVHLRFYDHGKRRIVSTGVKVAPYQWHPKYHVINHPDALQLNKTLDDALARIEKRIKTALSTGQPLPTGGAALSTSSATFLKFMESQIKSAKVAHGTRKHYYTALRSLEAYGKIQTFTDVTPAKIKAYLATVSATHSTPGTIRNYYKVLTKFIRLAIDRNFVAPTALQGVKCAREEPTNREHLFASEIETLRALPIASPYIARARDLFLVQCASGLAYIDLMEADFSQVQKYNEVYTLQGIRHKTKTSFFTVILPFGYEILLKYNFNLPKISNQKYNVYLKTLIEMAGIRKKVTSHVGRHTYACLCLSQGIRIEVVQKTLGHRDISTTQIYAKLVNQDVINAFSGLTTPPNLPHQESQTPSDQQKD